jgi:hypothetical protein
VFHEAAGGTDVNISDLIDNNPDMVSNMAQQAGIDPGQIGNVLSAVLPRLAGMAQQGAGLESLLGSLTGGGGDFAQLAEEAAPAAGISVQSLAGLMPMIGSLLSNGMGQGQSSAMDLVMGLLDQNKDGSVVDDALGIASRLFSGR